MDATRADVEFTAEVCAIAVAEGADVINIPDTVGYTTPEEYARYFARLYELVPRAARGRALGPLPRRPRARGRQLLRRAARRRPPGRVRDQRDRRAGRQLLAGGDRDAAADPPRRARARHRRSTPASSRAPRAWSRGSPATRCSRTRRSSGATRSRTSPGSTRTACSRSAPPTRSWTRARSASSRTRSCSASTPAATRCATRSSSSASRSRATRSTRRSSASRRSRTRRSR